MRAAAADLDFETAARLRDEIKRLQAVELTVADDPLARKATSRPPAAAFAARANMARPPATCRRPVSTSPTTTTWARIISAAAKRDQRAGASWRH